VLSVSQGDRSGVPYEGRLERSPFCDAFPASAAQKMRMLILRHLPRIDGQHRATNEKSGHLRIRDRSLSFAVRCWGYERTIFIIGG
jgi:hypothetical protein